MSKTTKYLIGVCTILTLFLVLTSYRTCQLYDKNSILKGNEEILVAQLNGAVKSLYKFRDEHVALLTQLKIQEEMATEAIDAATEATGTMVEGLRTVEHLKANAENDQALIAEMVLEIGKRDELIDKLVFTIKTQEERYFTLTEQYRITKQELKLSAFTIEKYQDTIEIKDLRIKGLERSLRGVRLSSGIKTPIILGLAAAVIYGLVK